MSDLAEAVREAKLINHENYYSESTQGTHSYFDLGAFKLEMGEILPNARLGYKTQGVLNKARDNAILFHTCTRAPPRQWSLRWDWPTARYWKVLHHLSRPVWQWLLVLAKQHPTAVRSGAISERHHRRRRTRAVPVANRAVQNR